MLRKLLCVLLIISLITGCSKKEDEQVVSSTPFIEYPKSYSTPEGTTYLGEIEFDFDYFRKKYDIAPAEDNRIVITVDEDGEIAEYEALFGIEFPVAREDETLSILLSLGSDIYEAHVRVNTDSSGGATISAPFVQVYSDYHDNIVFCHYLWNYPKEEIMVAIIKEDMESPNRKT